MHSIKELLKVSALKGWCSLRAGQDGHEVGNSFLKVASFPEATPQCIMNVLLNEAPVLSLVHAQRLPALAADLSMVKKGEANQLQESGSVNGSMLLVLQVIKV